MKYLTTLLLIALLIPSFASATSYSRFYLPSTGTPAVSVTRSASWTATSILESRPIATSLTSTTMTTQTLSAGLGNGTKAIFKQYISEPLAAQTISGNVTGQIRGSTNSNSSINYMMGIRIVSNDGTTVKQTPLNVTAFSTYPMSSSLRNQTLASTAITSSSVDAGDRLVIEIGMTRTAAWGAAGSAHSMSYGDDSGTDLPVNKTETSAYNPWIEFSNPIDFGGGGGSTTESPVRLYIIGIMKVIGNLIIK